jgi:hypothetical protein
MVGPMGDPPQYPDRPPLVWPGAPTDPTAAAPGGAVPEPAVGPPGRPRHRAAIVLAVTVVAVLIGALVGVVVDDDGGSGEASAPTSTTAGATSTTEVPTTSSTAAATDFDAVVAEVSEFVEQERGLEFLRPVQVELAADDEFEQRLLEDFDEDASDIEETEAVLRALELIDPDVDLVEELRSLLGAGVVGFYDPATDELVVRGTETTPYVRETMAHELTHALDDQHFELDRPDVDEADDERSFGFSSLVEGNAVRVEDAYVAAMSDEEQAEAYAEQLEIGSDFDILSVPRVVLQLVVAPYQHGPAFIRRILDEGGQARLDEAFAAPPTTSEQVLDPERYLAGEGAVSVPLPPADGEVVSQGAFGAFGFGELLPGEDDAVQGWGGDAYVAWLDGERACIRLAVVGDTPGDTDELAAALDSWASGHTDAEMVRGEGGGPVTVTACA